MRDQDVSGASQELGRCHAEQLELCVALERMADCLPDLPDRRALRAVDGLIVPLMHKVARQWALTFAPLAFTPSDSPFALLLCDLARQDGEDIGAAEEIQATMNDMRSGRDGLCAEAFGYLLRSFLTARRRRVILDHALMEAADVGSSAGTPCHKRRPDA